MRIGPATIRIFSRPSSCASLIHNRPRVSNFWTKANPAMTSVASQGAVAPSRPQAPAAAKTPGKRPYHNGNNKGKPAKFRKKQQKAPKLNEGSHEEVLMHDIQALLAATKLAAGEAEALARELAKPALPLQGSEIEVEVIEMSSTGDGLAKQKGSDQIYVVPFSVPGDTVKVKVYRHLEREGYTVADFIAVTKPSPLRNDSRIQCKYFAQCSGCQFQMLDYAEQLKLKKNIVVKAYRNFSQLPRELVPDVLDTIGSPLEYGYRTKLTPHFDGPPGAMRRGPRKPLEERPPIGFTPKTTRKVLDIEDCPIATDAVRKGLKEERERMETEFVKYTRGATILLRESTQRVPKTACGSGAAAVDEAEIAAAAAATTPASSSAITVETDTYTDRKTYITDNNATSTEYIDDFIFTNPAGSFFQNNNSILSPFTEYIRQHIMPPPHLLEGKKPIRKLIDAYSGSGLFTITQASLFPGGSIGIDIADKSIEFARTNATLNGLKEEQCRFIAADAPELFKSVAQYDPDETVVVLDPPRKGCDASFLRQLLEYGPRRVVYVSCNVHTQARDVGVLVRGEVDGMEGGGEEVKGDGEKEEKKKGTRYEIESIRGFDFFPQTGHVEGVAVLNRVEL